MSRVGMGRPKARIASTAAASVSASAPVEEAGSRGDARRAAGPETRCCMWPPVISRYMVIKSSQRRISAAAASRLAIASSMIESGMAATPRRLAKFAHYRGCCKRGYGLCYQLRPPLEEVGVTVARDFPTQGLGRLVLAIFPNLVIRLPCGSRSNQHGRTGRVDRALPSTGLLGMPKLIYNVSQTAVTTMSNAGISNCHTTRMSASA